MKTMFLDYQSLTVVILVSTFGLVLVAVVNDTMVYTVALVLVLLQILLLHLLAITIIVNQLLGMVEMIEYIITDTISMTHYGTEKDV